MHADVAVVGLGPVGALAAILLARSGLRVVCLERDAAPFAAPRAAATDDACRRIFQRAGLLEAELRGVLHVPAPAALVTAGGREVQVLDPSVRVDGHPRLVTFDQVELEEGLLAAVVRHGAEVRRGLTVQRVEQDASGATLRCAGGEDVRAAWVVACDGARSTLRAQAGIGFGGSTFARPWLVVDAEVDAPVAGVPGVRFVGDPRRPAVTLPLRPGLHRWEFMLAPGEPVPDWRPLVARWADLADLRPVRAAVYTYHARVAERWRDGRVLLLGDAAHVMPPFAGQGLSAGLRDADNAAWKLAAVVGGAPDPLLDTIESERRPDVERFSRLARCMGAVLQTRRPRAARARDAALGGLARVPVAGPWFSAGGVRPASTLGPGAVFGGRGAGRSAPQPRVRGRDGRTGLLDDLLPPGWAVVATGGQPAWEHAGVAVLVLGRDLHDLDGALAGWLRRRRAEGVVLRPDRHVFAAGGTGLLARAAQDFATRWAAPSFSPPPAA